MSNGRTKSPQRDLFDSSADDGAGIDDEAAESADYSLARVPAHARLGWRTVTIQSFGQAGNIGLLMLGTLLGSAFGFATGLMMLLIGLGIQAITLIAMGAIGAREGIATTVLTRWTGLGRYGSALLGMVLATCVIGWFIVLNSTIAGGFALVTGGPKWIWALGIGTVFTLVVMFGFGLMARTATVTAPAFLALTAYFVVITVTEKGFASVVATGPFGPKMTTAAAVTAVVAVWLTGIVVQPDMTRFVKAPADVVRVTLFGTILGQLLIGGSGVVLAAATRSGDVIGIITTGSVLLGMTFLITATANIQNLNLYVATLSLANAVDTLFSWRPRPSMITLTVGLSAAGVSALGVLNTLDTFLNLLGGVLPPVVGIVLAEYYVVRRWSVHLDRTRHSGRLPQNAPGWVVTSLIVWVTASTVGFTVTVGIPVINALVTAFVLAVFSGLVMRTLTRLTGIGGLTDQQMFVIDIEMPGGGLAPIGTFGLDPDSGELVEMSRPDDSRHRKATELLVRLTNGTIEGRRPDVIGAVKIRTEITDRWPNQDGAPLVTVRFNWATPNGATPAPRHATGRHQLPTHPTPEETTIATYEAISSGFTWRQNPNQLRHSPHTGVDQVESVRDSGPRRTSTFRNGGPPRDHGSPRSSMVRDNSNDTGTHHRPVRRVDTWQGRIDHHQPSGRHNTPAAHTSPHQPPMVSPGADLFGWFGGDRRD
jgi:cytosine permease